MHIVTSQSPDRRLIASAYQRTSTAALRLVRGVGVLAILAGLEYLLIAMPLGLCGIGVGLLVIFGVPALMVSRAVNRSWQFLGQPTTYTITDWGVERTDPLTRQAYAWPAVSGIDHLPGQLLFTIGKIGFVPMATDGLTAGELEQILAMADTHAIPVRLRR